jgi:protein Tex
MVIGVADFGVFVDLGPECSGLIHISRLAPDFIEDPHQFVQVGDLVPVWVLNVDEKKKRVSLTAIAPGTNRRSDASGREGHATDHGVRGSNQRDGQGQANQRGAAQGNRRPAQARDGNASRPSSAGAGATSSENRGGDNRRSGGAARGGSRNEGQRGGGGGRNRNSGGFDRDRRNQSQESSDSASRRPARVEPPKPVTPITDAMQQGKEPLRSFSDLLQFMKAPKEEPSIEQPSAPKSSSGDTPVVEASQSTSDANRVQESDNSAPPA